MGTDKTSQKAEVFDPTATTFNGIPRFETWTVLKWIQEDPRIKAFWNAEARKAYAQTREVGDPVVKLAEVLERKHTAAIPISIGVYGDLITTALRRVDWREVAETILGNL